MLSVSFSPGFDDPSGLNLLGRAAVTNDPAVSTNDILRLTPAEQGPTGGAWFTGQQFVSVDFETTFQFSMNDGSDAGDGTDGSDGFAFVIQNDSVNASGRGANGVGYDEIPNSLAVEFDTWGNSEMNDPSKSHISVHTRGTLPNEAHEDYSLGSYDTYNMAGFILDDAQVHTATISYGSATQTLSVSLDNLGEVLTVSVDLAEILDLNVGRAWVGFVGATGGGWQNHDILNWQYDTLVDTSTVIAIEDVQQVEGDDGTTTDFVFTVSRVGDTSGSVAIDWATEDGTATAGSDYVADAGQVIFNSEDTEQTFTVTANGDNVEEDHETFFVNTTLNSGIATIVDARGGGTILNDETTVTIDDVTVIEGDQTPRFIDQFVTNHSDELDYPSDLEFGPVGDLYVASVYTHNVLRYDGTTGMLIGEFITGGDGGLQWPSGLAFQPDGNLYVCSVGTDQVLRYNGLTGDFLDVFVGDDPATPAVDESGGLDWASEMTFGPDGNLYVSSRSTNSVLRYSGTTGASMGEFVAPGSGGLNGPEGLTFGSDGNLYVASSANHMILRYHGSSGAWLDEFVPGASGGLSWPHAPQFGADGNLYVTSAVGDAVLRYEGTTGEFIDEFVPAKSGGLDNPRDFAFGSDGNLYVNSANSDGVLRYGASSQAVFTVSLSNPSVETVTVDYATADGTATAGSDDYVTTSGTVVFEPGVTQRSILVPTLDDTVSDSGETFLVNLSNPSDGAALADSQGTATIAETTTTTYAWPDGEYRIKNGFVHWTWFSIDDSFPILDLDVQLDITHSDPDDLRISLRHHDGPDNTTPGGTKVELVSNGDILDGTRLDHTILDDEASISIEDGAAPYAGSYRPSTPLAAFDSEDIQGTWELEIRDLAGMGWHGDHSSGKCHAWSITVTHLMLPSEPGITVEPSSALVTSEKGESVTFEVVLDTEPTDTVVLNLVSNDPTEGALSATTLTFTAESGVPGGWDVPQTVTVIGLDDPEKDGDIPYTVTVSVDALLTADLNYLALAPIDVSLTNKDNEKGKGGGKPKSLSTDALLAADELFGSDGPSLDLFGLLADERLFPATSKRQGNRSAVDLVLEEITADPFDQQLAEDLALALV